MHLFFTCQLPWFQLFPEIWPIESPFLHFLPKNMRTHPAKTLVPCFYVGIENAIKMGVDEHHSNNSAHVVLNINTIEHVKEGQLCLGYINALNGVAGSTCWGSFASAITLILSTTQLVPPASSPSHFVHFFNVVKMLSFNKGAIFGCLYNLSTPTFYSLWPMIDVYNYIGMHMNYLISFNMPQKISRSH